MTDWIEVRIPCIHAGLYIYKSRLVDGFQAHPLEPNPLKNRGQPPAIVNWCGGGTSKKIVLTDAIKTAACAHIQANGWHGEPNKYDIEYMTAAIKKGLELE